MKERDQRRQVEKKDKVQDAEPDKENEEKQEAKCYGEEYQFNL